MQKLPKDKQIILFDGVCNLCNYWVQYIIKHDKNDIFRFVTLESELGQEVLQYLGIKNRNIESIVLYIPNQAYYYKSEAVLKIAQSLSILNWFFIFKIIPINLRDFLYDFVAKNRYKWYEKKVTCMIPSPELKTKFID
ncbi:thiol-disulfide oxidoreductase DCC family protein [Flavobacterium covae]